MDLINQAVVRHLVTELLLSETCVLGKETRQDLTRMTDLDMPLRFLFKFKFS